MDSRGRRGCLSNENAKWVNFSTVRADRHQELRKNVSACYGKKLLQAVNRGEFASNGFRNRDLRELLFPKQPTAEAEQRRQSAAITRKLRLLRAHGLIHKVAKTHRYQLSPHGRETINALLIARQASTATLAA